MFVGTTKGGAEVESAIRRAAPSRKPNQRAGPNSLVVFVLKDAHLLGPLYLVSEKQRKGRPDI